MKVDSRSDRSLSRRSQSESPRFSPAAKAPSVVLNSCSSGMPPAEKSSGWSRRLNFLVFASLNLRTKKKTSPATPTSTPITIRIVAVFETPPDFAAALLAVSEADDLALV